VESGKNLDLVKQTQTAEAAFLAAAAVSYGYYTIFFQEAPD
jgi:hypothetical protein